MYSDEDKIRLTQNVAFIFKININFIHEICLPDSIHGLTSIEKTSRSIKVIFGDVKFCYCSNASSSSH